MPLDDEDAVQIVVGGVSYQSWLEVDVESDIMTPADAWSVTAAMPGDDIRDVFREGAKCDVFVGRDRQMSGVIDAIRFRGDRQSTRMVMAGRDKGAYLVESEADALKATNLTVKTLIEKLLKPEWGIKRVVTSNDDNRKLVLGKKDKKGVRSSSGGIFSPVPRESSKIDPGRAVAQILDEHTERLGLAWWMTAQGDLFIGKPNYNQEIAYYFRCEEATNKKSVGNNIETFEVARSIDGRFSEVQVNGSGMPSKKGLFDKNKAAPKYKATSVDPDLRDRGVIRRLVLRDCDVLNRDEAQTRANAEQGRRRLGGLAISLTVPGFRDRETGRLYSIDTLASVKIPEAGIDGTYYVTRRRFREDRGKRRTEITLHEKGVWLT